MLLLNLDCTDFFYHHDTTVDGGKQLDRYIDLMLEAGITHMICNTQAERTNYASNVWEPFWTGYDSDKGLDQPFFASIYEENTQLAEKWHSLVASMWNLKEQGIDYPARIIERSKKHSVSAWISLRMNDVHCQNNENHPIHSNFWRNNPQFRRKGYPGYFEKALDYAYPEVRNHYFALINETLDRYDVDGLELDFMREPFIFSKGEESKGKKILNNWLQDIHRLLKQRETERQHPIELGIRLPSHPDVAERFGFDFETWAREGLVDIIIPTPRWASIEFDIPVARWQDLLKNTRVKVVPGLEVNCRPYSSCQQFSVTPESAIGAASQFLASGSDGIYLFNYFPSGQPTGRTQWWSTEIYKSVLSSMNSLKDLLGYSRSHYITCRDINMPTGAGFDQLPASGTEIELFLPTGPKPGTDERVILAIDVKSEHAARIIPPTASVNDRENLMRLENDDQDLKSAEYPVCNDCQRYLYKLSGNSLLDCKENKFVIKASNNNSITVSSVRVDIKNMEKKNV